tara:strand:- start:56 stop:205 length:150 start_codon:yes stop_codon:yes gene_type:complete
MEKKDGSTNTLRSSSDNTVSRVGTVDRKTSDKNPKKDKKPRLRFVSDCC